ncbi:MAG: hypothetical protein ACSHXK_12615 [Oceanococcus sp.]
MIKNIMRPASWPEIRRIQTLNIVRSMYVWLFVVPLLAKAFSRLEEVATVTVFGHTFQLILELPFSWVVFYASALAFVAANILYQVWCPTIVKDHENWASFEGAGKLEEHLKSYEEELHRRGESFHAAWKLQAQSYRQDPQQTFWRLHDHAANMSLRVRRVATGLNFVGFSLVAIVAFENLVAVARLMVANGV